MRLNSLRVWMFCLVVMGLLALTAMVVLADNTFDPSKDDGRINRTAWMNNYAVYCVDQDGNPTSDGWSNGGIRVLDGNGQPVLFASAADIDAVGVPGSNTAIKSDNGLTLYRQPDSQFSINGIDSGGAPYTFVFANCVPTDALPQIGLPVTSGLDQNAGHSRGGRPGTPEPTLAPPPTEVGIAQPSDGLGDGPDGTITLPG